jgi:hypothetical protein
VLKSVKVPPPFEQPFARAESFVEKRFSEIDRKPERGTLHVSGERYILVRAESLYATWFEALAETFGDEAAGEFIYNTAREIGRSDSMSFSKRLNVTEPLDRVAAGPPHFSHSGWAFVEILGDSNPQEAFFHYVHPNTFESEVSLAKGKKSTRCACLFSAGYSAGWVSDAFQTEIHARELRCLVKGDALCEFIMAPAPALDDHDKRVRSAW